MIFLFRDSIDALEAQDRGQVHDVVSDLLRAHRSGHHMVIIDRQTADWLLANIQFNQRDSAMLSNLRSSYTQTASLVEQATDIVLVKPSHLGGPKVEDGRVTLGLKDADWRYLLLRSNLLVENQQYDGALIELILSIVNSRVGAPQINFEKRNGGGTAIFDVWKDLIVDGYIVCLVADSDRRHPDAKPNEKFKEAADFAEGKQHYLAFCLPLPCLEAENLIPLEVISDLPCCRGKAQEIDALKRIDAAEKAADIEFSKRFIYFYDLKEGVKESDLQSNDPPGASCWYKQRIDMGGKAASYKGIGHNLVGQLLRDDRLKFEFGKAIGRSDRWKGMFEEYFLRMCWIGFAPRPNVL